jgi:hypothetical protein
MRRFTNCRHGSLHLSPNHKHRQTSTWTSLNCVLVPRIQNIVEEENESRNRLILIIVSQRIIVQLTWVSIQNCRHLFQNVPDIKLGNCRLEINNWYHSPWDFFPLEDIKDRLSRNVGKKIPLYAALNTDTVQISFTPWRKPGIKNSVPQFPVPVNEESDNTDASVYSYFRNLRLQKESTVVYSEAHKSRETWRWRLILAHLQNGSCPVSSFRRLEFWGGS